MRLALLISLLSISLSASASLPISQNAFSALESDDAIALLSALDQADLDSCYSYKASEYTPLIMTIKAGATDSFRALIDKGVDLEKTCSNKTPLMYAAKYDQLQMAKVLIEAGADYTRVNDKGRSAKDYSKKYKRKQIYLYFKSLETEEKKSSNSEKFRDW